ncbi:NUDIX hydrolase [Nonomuraea endophytica]|uniref:NUDIX hydrolase n=1 Tax=Nonomuraea endophytica TaxID=714136 RepID=UPI0037CA5CF6
MLALNGEVRTRVSAYAIVTSAGRLLLTRLSENSPIFPPGAWHLPGGGIDPGEQPEQALARELREETGLDLTSAHLVAARTYAVTRLGVSWHLVGLFYAAEVAPGSPAVTEVNGTTDEVAWLPIATLTSPDAPDPGNASGTALSPAAADALRLLGEGEGEGEGEGDGHGHSDGDRDPIDGGDRDTHGDAHGDAHSRHGDGGGGWGYQRL